jgi:hypothetical protein
MGNAADPACVTEILCPEDILQFIFMKPARGDKAVGSPPPTIPEVAGQLNSGLRFNDVKAEEFRLLLGINPCPPPRFFRKTNTVMVVPVDGQIMTFATPLIQKSHTFSTFFGGETMMILWNHKNRNMTWASGQTEVHLLVDLGTTPGMKIMKRKEETTIPIFFQLRNPNPLLDNRTKVNRFIPMLPELGNLPPVNDLKSIPGKHSVRPSISFHHNLPKDG